MGLLWGLLWSPVLAQSGPGLAKVWACSGRLPSLVWACSWPSLGLLWDRSRPAPGPLLAHSRPAPSPLWPRCRGSGSGWECPYPLAFPRLHLYLQPLPASCLQACASFSNLSSSAAFCPFSSQVRLFLAVSTRFVASLLPLLDFSSDLCPSCHSLANSVRWSPYEASPAQRL